jgi:hypothetical protein
MSGQSPLERYFGVANPTGRAQPVRDPCRNQQKLRKFIYFRALALAGWLLLLGDGFSG